MLSLFNNSNFVLPPFRIIASCLLQLHAGQTHKLVMIHKVSRTLDEKFSNWLWKVLPNLAEATAYLLLRPLVPNPTPLSLPEVIVMMIMIKIRLEMIVLVITKTKFTPCT